MSSPRQYWRDIHAGWTISAYENTHVTFDKILVFFKQCKMESAYKARHTASHTAANYLEVRDKKFTNSSCESSEVFAKVQVFPHFCEFWTHVNVSEEKAWVWVHARWRRRGALKRNMRLQGSFDKKGMYIGRWTCICTCVKSASF
jgi:hypothetical protein